MGQGIIAWIIIGTLTGRLTCPMHQVFVEVSEARRPASAPHGDDFRHT